MQMTDEVKHALQVLRDNAENDFELHRIGVLERDLTSPPQVEIIDDKHQRFLELSFCKRANGYYYNPNLSIYRFVWTYYHGELPEDCAIHHIDCDKNNNAPSNLIALTHEEHCQLHGKKSRKIKPPKPPTPPKQPRTRICPVCGNAFEMRPKESTNKGRKTCSDECEEILRKQRDNERKVNRSRICEVCGKPYEYKKKKQKTCSPECGKILSARTLKQRRAE